MGWFNRLPGSMGAVVSSGALLGRRAACANLPPSDVPQVSFGSIFLEPVNAEKE